MSLDIFLESEDYEAPIWCRG